MAGCSWGLEVLGGDTAITVKRAQLVAGGFGVTAVVSRGGGGRIQLYSNCCKQHCEASILYMRTGGQM